jgi:hypothetical protein
VPEQIQWDEDAVACIRTRSQRYVGAVDIEPDWTQEALDDPDVAALEPDPKSRVGACRFIGEPPTLGVLLVVIAYRDLDSDLQGVNAWPATGVDRVVYEEGNYGDDSWSCASCEAA